MQCFKSTILCWTIRQSWCFWFHFSYGSFYKYVNYFNTIIFLILNFLGEKEEPADNSHKLWCLGSHSNKSKICTYNRQELVQKLKTKGMKPSVFLKRRTLIEEVYSLVLYFPNRIEVWIYLWIYETLSTWVNRTIFPLIFCWSTGWSWSGTGSC